MTRRQTTKHKKPAARKRQRRTPAKPRKQIVVRVKVKHKAGVGRKKGAKNKVPTFVKHTVKAIMEEVLTENVKDIKMAVIEGIQSGPMYADKFIVLLRNSTDGVPTSGLDIKATFKEDELSAAGRDLERKMNALFKHAAPDPENADPALPETPPT